MTIKLSEHRRSEFPYWVRIHKSMKDWKDHAPNRTRQRLDDDRIYYKANYSWTNLGYGFGKSVNGYVYKFYSEEDRMHFVLCYLGGLG